MATSLSTAFVTLFEAEVKQAYQGFSQLVGSGAVRVRRGVEGSTVKFPKLGKGVASVRIPQTDVTPMNLTWTQATCTLTDYNAAEYSDIFNQAKVNFEERNELVQAVAAAIGRRQDQLVIDALVSETISSTVDENIGGTDSNLNVDKLREAARLLNTDNVPMSDRHWLTHASNMSALLGETETTSSDFASVKALVEGSINTFMGFRFHVIGDRDEGGLAKATNDRDNFAWHKSAVGYAEGIGPKVEINYIPEKTSWLVNALLSAGAVVIDEQGAVEITCDESDLG
jgi:hypothetical protein